jgi:putative membrane protein
MTPLSEVPWEFYPSVLIGMALWTMGYVLVVNVLPRRPSWRSWPGPLRQAVFHFGTLTGLLALVSPLDGLGDEYLFSAHMTQHMLLIYVTAPCWLIGLPGWLLDALVPKRLQRHARQVRSAVLALVLFSSVTLIWHLPAVYDLALAHEWLHIVQHLSYMGAGMIGWWPILGPASRAIPIPAPPLRMLYGFVAALPGMLLGAILTFAREPLYPYYLTVEHPFGLTALADQQLAGLIMWIPTHMIVVVCLAVIGGRWLNREGAYPDPSSNIRAD